MIDLHSHILPGIDDGAGSIDDSLDLARELHDAGVTEVFATPHYITETIYTSPKKANLKLVSDLQKRLDVEGVDLKVHLGNEIYICKEIADLVSGGEVSGLGGFSYLLVELPMSGDFLGYYDIFLGLIRAGYKVVLAHPERYTSFASDFSLVSELFEMGVLMQCNVGSFAGQYGKTVFKLARRMAKEKMIWGMGSDIHHVHPGLLNEGLKKLSKYYNDDELEQILVGNPKKILRADAGLE